MAFLHCDLSYMDWLQPFSSGVSMCLSLKEKVLRPDTFPYSDLHRHMMSLDQRVCLGQEGSFRHKEKKCGITKAHVYSGSAILHLKILPYLLKFINKRQVQTIQHQSQLTGLMVMWDGISLYRKCWKIRFTCRNINYADQNLKWKLCLKAKSDYNKWKVVILSCLVCRY